MTLSVKPKKHTFSFWLRSALFAFLGTALIFTAFLPSLLSSSWGKEKLVALINRSIPGKISIQALSLSWIGSQHIQGLSLLDPEGHSVLSLEDASAKATLYALIANPTTAGSIELNSLNLHLEGDGNGGTNLMQAISKNCCLDLQDRSPVVIDLNDMHGTLNFSDHGPITLQMKGQTQQNQLQGNFLIDAEMVGLSLKEVLKGKQDLTQLLASHPEAELKMNADINHFPVELLDQLISLRSSKFSGFLTDLLGDQLNLKMDQKASTQGVFLNIQANAPSLSLAADLLLDKEITLVHPAKVQLSLTPESAEKLMSLLKVESPWVLSSPTTLNLVVSRLQLPLNVLTDPLEHVDTDAIGLEGALNLDQATFHNGAHESLTLKSVRMGITADVNSPKGAITLTADAIHQEQPTRLNLNLSFLKSSLLNLSNISFRGVSANGEIKGVPLAVLDEFIKSSPPLSSILGSSADLTFSLQSQGESPVVSVQFKSETLEVPLLTFSIDQKITLQKPAQIILQLNQSLVSGVFQDQDIKILGPATAQLTVNSLSLPTSHLLSSLRMMYHLDLEATLKLTSLRFANLPTVGALSVNDFSARLVAKPKNRPELAVAFSLQPDGTSSFTDLIGKKANVKTVATLGIGIDGNPTANLFNLQVVSDLARIELSGEIHEGNKLLLSTPALLRYTLTEAGLRAMGITNKVYSFQHESPLELTIDSSYIPLNFRDLARLHLNGQLKLNQVKLMQKAEVTALIDNVAANWTVDAASKLITIDFTGMTRLGENQGAGKISGSARAKNWIKGDALDFKQTAMSVNINANTLPTELISAFSQQQDLGPLLGNAIDLSVMANMSLSPQQTGDVSFDVQSQNLSCRFNLLFGEMIELNKNRPAEISFKITPQSYAALRRRLSVQDAGQFAITEPATATLTLRSLRLPRSQTIAQAGVEGSFAVSRLVGMDTTTKNQIVLNSINGNIASQNLADSINFDMKATGHDAKGNETAWNMTGVLNQGLTDEGKLNRDDLSLSFNTTIKSLPVPLLCNLVCVDPKLRQKIEVLIGPVLNANIQAQLQRMNGPILADIQGTNGQVSLDAYLNEGIMTLNKDLSAQLSVTKEFGEHALKDFIPFLGGMLSAERPIYLTIHKEGFYLPLRDPSVLSMHIQRASLDAGKVRFSEQSQMTKMLHLLTPNASNQLIWITPAYFSLKQGNLNLERVDMLINDTFPIATWGDIDIGKDRVNMVVGLSGAAITRAFHVTGVANDYFLQLPLKGRLNSASIDKAKATARISALAAHSQGGPQGLVLGTVIDIATGGFNEGTAPPPTTQPLPWQEMLAQRSAPAEPSGKTERQAIPNPIEEIGKGASSLIKKIFK